jgi:membrane protease YdiL (CAAX protease family)
VQPEIRQPEAVPPVIGTHKQNTGLWGGWPTVGLGAAILAMYLAVQTVVAIAFVIRQLNTSFGPPSLQSMLNLETNGNLISIATIVSAIVGLGFIILFIKIRKGAGLWNYLGLKSISKKAFLILLLVVIGLIMLSFVPDQVLHVQQDTGFTVDAYETTTWPALLWIAVVVFAPLFEESFFRGFVFVGLKQTRIGAVGTIAVTSLTWALLHIEYDIYGMATVLVLGIVFGIIRLKTGSLWSTLFLHSMWNILGMVGTVLYVNGTLH